jgi:acyl-CoA thioester hydrolase
MDPQGHVNNAVFSTYFESGRVAMFRRPDLGIGMPGLTLVLVRIEINFLKELRWPGTVEIGTGLVEFGRTSFTVAQAIFCGDVCAASARAKLVCLDEVSRTSRTLPEALVTSLSQWKYLGS